MGGMTGAISTGIIVFIMVLISSILIAIEFGMRIGIATFGIIMAIILTIDDAR